MHSLGQVRWLNLSPTATTRRCDDGDTSFWGTSLFREIPSCSTSTRQPSKHGKEENSRAVPSLCWILTRGEA